MRHTMRFKLEKPLAIFELVIGLLLVASPTAVVLFEQSLTEIHPSGLFLLGAVAMVIYLFGFTMMFSGIKKLYKISRRKKR